LAIAHELKRLRPDVTIVYIGQKGDKLGDLPRHNPDIDLAYNVRAGKFRRYHGEGVKQLFDVKTTLKNVRDIGFVFVGFFQSWLLLRKIRPDSLFIKGGFVGVPVGLAAAICKIPFITHDSDAMPGLANRIIGRWATVHAVALPKEVYQYAPQKTVTVGVPVHTNYKPVTPEIKAKFRDMIGLGEYDQVLLITGGGLGARRLNTVAAAIVPDLLRDYAKLAVVHTVGRGNEAVMHQTYEQELSPADLKRVVIDGYLTELYKYSGASDVIIARAGATNLAEFAVQGKACVVVPNPLLTGGHQLKNAAYLADHKAIEIVTEEDTKSHNGKLEAAVRSILDNPSLRDSLSHNLSTFAKPNASAQLAELLLRQAPQKANS
jgi:UDP-N-acetylglucosamine--N-acetylmuramyl-(pentapeptide) pyrophosphoryl-undecaprenol N-acetylglucosamine transferase